MRKAPTSCILKACHLNDTSEPNKPEQLLKGLNKKNAKNEPSFTFQWP